MHSVARAESAAFLAVADAMEMIPKTHAQETRWEPRGVSFPCG